MRPCAVPWCMLKVAGLWQKQTLLSRGRDFESSQKVKPSSSHDKLRAGFADADSVNYWCLRIRSAPFPALIIKAFSGEIWMAPHFFWLCSGHSCSNMIVL